MTDDGDFHPIWIGGALLVLESELRDELASDEPGEALFRLRLELGRVIRRARAWAQQRHISVHWIPDPPEPTAGPHECLALLRELASALNALGINVDLIALHELDASLGELSSALSGVCETANALAREAESLAIVGADLGGATFSQRVVQQCATLADIAAALATLRRVVQSWRLGEMQDLDADNIGASSSDSSSGVPSKTN